ncbi:unnamed protein product [Rhizophagus irregularis]|nr:unnamed protein product [Rhizophagus irregularis]
MTRGLKNENNLHIIIRLPTVPWRISQAYLVKWDVSGSSTILIRLDKEGNAEDYKVERYLREHPTPTSTEEVQNWFNGLMMELPSFKRKLLVESTHNDPYLDGFKPRLSVFLEDDAHIPMLVQMLLSVKKRKSESGFADEDKGQLIDYMNILIQQQPLRENFALFLSDGSNFYIMGYEGERQILYITWKVHKNTSEVVFRHLQQYTNKIDYNDIPAALKYSQHQDLQHEAEIIRFLNGRNILNII